MGATRSIAPRLRSRRRETHAALVPAVAPRRRRSRGSPRDDGHDDGSLGVALEEIDEDVRAGAWDVSVGGKRGAGEGEPELAPEDIGVGPREAHLDAAPVTLGPVDDARDLGRVAAGGKGS